MKPTPIPMRDYILHILRTIAMKQCLGCEVRDGDLYALMSRFDNILGREVEQRRIAQDSEHGGPEHDDTHTPSDWCEFIRKFAGRAEYQAQFAAERYEDNLIHVAALAIAAIQSSRRKRG